jgi:hypothetical protein
LTINNIVEKPAVVIAYDPNEPCLPSAIAYFKEHFDQPWAVKEFKLPPSLKEYRSTLASYESEYTVKKLYILAHGIKGSGLLEFSSGEIVDASELQLQKGGPAGRFMMAAQCYAHLSPSRQQQSAPNVLLDRALGNHMEVGSKEGYLGDRTWCVPRQLVDGGEGFVHSVLDPKIVSGEYPDVIPAILDYLQREQQQEQQQQGQ